MTLKKSFSYRVYWMGFAILYVMLFHLNLDFENYYINSIKRVGYCGVDIFMFAAGIGNFYSYLRDEAPLAFLKRRLLRLGPSYLIFAVIWLIYRIISHSAGFSMIIGNLFGIQGFTNNGNEFNWYLTLIILCYLLTPYLATFVKGNGLRNNCLLVAMFILISVAFWNDTKFIITASRFPIFVTGMLFAKYDSVTVSKRNMLLLGIAAVAGFLFLHFSFACCRDYLCVYALYWYPFVFIVPFVCTLISYAIHFIERNKKVCTLFSPLLLLLKTAGECSFELFLTHIFLFELAEKFAESYEMSNILFVYFIAVAASFASAFLLNRFSAFLKRSILRIGTG